MSNKIATVKALLIWFYCPIFIWALQDDNRILIELENAKKNYFFQSESIRNIFFKKIDDQIKITAQSGNLELVQRLLAEKKEFEMDNSKIPKAKEFKSSVSFFQKENKKTKNILVNVYEKAIIELTKNIELELAIQVKNELAEIQNNSDSQLPMAGTTKDKDEKKQTPSYFGNKTIRFKTGPYFFYSPTNTEKILILRKIGDTKIIDSQFGFNLVPGLAGKETVAFASTILPDHFLVVQIVNRDERIQMVPQRNASDYNGWASFYLRRTPGVNEFLIESYYFPGFFLVPGSTEVIRFKKDDGSKDFKKNATVKIEEFTGKK